MRGLKTAFFISLFFLSSCRLFDPTEEIPVYVSLENPEVLVDSLQNHRSDIGVKDVWVYQSGVYLGTFPFPSTIPILPSKGRTLTLQGGIFESGLSSFRVNYPFWDEIDIEVEADLLDTHLIQPLFTYRPNDFIEVEFEEDFEGLDIAFTGNESADSSTLFRTSADFFLGTSCGRANFDENRKVMEVISAPFFTDINKNIYAEITYKSDFEFLVGITYYDPVFRQVFSPVVFTPKGSWNTIYVHLVEEIRQITGSVNDEYNLYIYVPGNGETGTFQMDNVRVISAKQ